VVRVAVLAGEALPMRRMSSISAGDRPRPSRFLATHEIEDAPNGRREELGDAPLANAVLVDTAGLRRLGWVRQFVGTSLRRAGGLHQSFGVGSQDGVGVEDFDPSFQTLLVPAVGAAPLTTPGLLTALDAAVALSAVAREHSKKSRGSRCRGKTMPPNDFVQSRPPSVITAGIGQRQWLRCRLESACVW
jgi:hypothetical protein